MANITQKREGHWWRAKEPITTSTVRSSPASAVGHQMVDGPTYIRNLKNYAKARVGAAEDITAALADVQSESDRGAIILAATGIEDMLEYQILARLPGLRGDIEARKRLFENDGPLASFSKKLWMAYAMGFVDKPYRKLIDIIREIRNACAHGRKPLSLESPELQTACKAVIKDMLPELKDRSRVTLRNAFVCKCAFINHYLATGEKIEGKEARLQHWKKLKLKSAAKPSP